MIAPASLKHDFNETLREGDVVATPGHDCPGLIEAGEEPSVGSGAEGRHSGA